MPRERHPDPDRRWRIPPVPTHASHSFAGAVLLEELSGPPGFALWQSFRDVQLWSLAPPGERSRLFAPGAAAARAVALDDPELKAPLRVLLEMVERPTTIRAEEVAAACAAISRWAEARGATASALAFAEAAAGACPEDAALAFVAGRLARRRAEWARAETWLLRAAGLGRRSGDWESYAQAWVAMGKIQIHRGSLARARRALLRGVRAARRAGLRGVEGQALHNLFVVETEADDLPAAEAWAREAYHAYLPRHPELPHLAHDLALVWSMQGFHGRAQSVFRAVLPYFTLAVDRLFLHANMVRTAGAAGDRAVFEEAWAAAWKLVESPSARGSHSRALVDMARGAASLGEWALAEKAASRAATLAAEREEGKALVEAEALLDSLRSRTTEQDAPPRGIPSNTTEGDALAEEIIAGLAAGAGT